jgi:hypothetical protein
MTEHPAEDFSGSKTDEPLVDDLLDETRGPGQVGPVDRADVGLRTGEVADDVKRRN